MDQQATEDRFFFISTQTIAWREYGDPRGEPVLYFGGTPGSRLEGSFAHEAALARGIRLIAIERPGLGLSTAQPVATVTDCARQFLDLANELELDEFGVVGYSAGGLYALAVAHAAPGRVRFVADMAGPAPMYRPELRRTLPPPVKLPFFYHAVFSGLRLAATRMSRPRFSTLLRDRLCRGADRDWLRDPDRAERFTANMVEALAQVATGCAQDIGRVYRPWGFEIEDITTPVHVWYGDADERISRELIDYKIARLPHAELHLTPGIGHLHLLDRFGDVFDSVRGSRANGTRNAV
jgi:pimeloyl-ACP methyl ester carboxylesterase